MTISEPLVSVVIPTYNRAYILERTIQTVLSQTYQNFEIIVVDDASTDNTPQLMKRWADSRIQYIRYEPNRGVCVARNIGMNTAQGEYIALLDSDDQWSSQKLEKQLSGFNKPEVGAVYCWSYFIGIFNEIKRLRISEARGNLRENLLYRNFIGSASTIMFKREVLEKGIYFNPELPFCEDWDFFIQLAKHYEFEVIREGLLYYSDDLGQKDRATTKSSMITEGFIKFLNHYHTQLPEGYKNIGTLTLDQKSVCFFRLGQTLICHGQRSNHLQGVQLGCKYLKFSYGIAPYKLRFLYHYLSSLMGGDFYVKMNDLEKSIRQNLGKLKFWKKSR
ncbi:glycosyltransferase [Spirulina subsalsa FACHB-351]|uniref:Glycosyltransferase n=1 Tax=Spirulina subsalsa FACHB-351 TaxID=234711 RepID=A0ABT3L1L4_9CYAN|nr:glycosyltransferase family 2 protein [Spirulina subsalsa]MCW6035355.1 glycosyltransferase [Spirulina subsalsa FACHB-351]